ncbi:MAG: hypothetical protein K0Q94_3679 [Paenibacillus sp.]|jgi:hypothetical protein|nr:hypothetical protein [Paenibacillus sp.]
MSDRSAKPSKRAPDLLDGLYTVVASNSQNKSGLHSFISSQIGLDGGIRAV